MKRAYVACRSVKNRRASDVAFKGIPPAGACDGTRAGGYAAGVTGSTIHNFRSYLVHPLTRRVLQELGIDASGLRAKGIRLFLGKVPIRYAVVVCERANRSCPKVYPFAARTLYWPLEDPAEAEGSREDRLAVFRRVRDEIAGRVRRFVLEGV